MSEETIPQMRERIEALEKQNKGAEQALAAANEKARLFEARDAFREKGLNPKHADLFVKTHEGDITTDAVSGFATEYNLASAPSTASAETADGEGSGQSVDDSALNALSRAGSGAGEGGAATAGDGPMSRETWEALNKTDPSAAKAALRQGNVQIRGDNPWRAR